VHDPLLVARLLGEMAMVNVASPAYLAAHGRPATPDELLSGGHRLIHYSQTWADRRPRFDWLDADGSPRSLTLPARVTVNNTDAYQAAAVGGAGIAQFPLQGVRHLLADGRLERVLAGFDAAPLPVRLVMSQRRHTPQRVRVFMDWLAEQIAPRLRNDNPPP
jgi:DNA-binding transcriptional LysR family regulator